MMGNLNIDQRVREFDLPTIHPPEDYQYVKSRKYRRKRRSINPSFMPELRIMRHDIRRKYGEMFVNVSNNHEISLMKRYIGEFMKPDCLVGCAPQCNIYKRIDQIYLHEKDKPRNSIERYLHGFIISCRMIPDQVIRLQECQVRTRQGSQGSIIVLKLLVNSVQLFTPDLFQVKEEHELQCDKEICSISSSISSNNKTFDELSIREDISPSSQIIDKGSKYRLTLLQSPVETIAKVLIIMVLDENHFIQQFHLEDQCISENLIQTQCSSSSLY